jgi:imidazolonepropionase
MPGLLVTGAREVATLAGGVRRGIEQREISALRTDDPAAPDAPCVAVWDGRIVAVGPRTTVEAALEGGGYPIARFARLDAVGGTVTPGLIDPHTHLLFGVSRGREFAGTSEPVGPVDVADVADVAEVAAPAVHPPGGPDILATIDATRATSEHDLLAHGRRWTDEMLAHGVTTIEAKSGYGLDLETELRLIEIAWRLGQEGPLDVVPTWLGAQTPPRAWRASRMPAAPRTHSRWTRLGESWQPPGHSAWRRASTPTSWCRSVARSLQ